MAREGESESESERGNHCTRGLQWQQLAAATHLRSSLARLANTRYARARVTRSESERASSPRDYENYVEQLRKRSIDSSVYSIARRCSLLDPLQAR